MSKYVDAEDELRDAFKVLDYENKGYISAGDLKHFLMNVGDKLSPEEMEAMINEADPDKTGKIDYKKYAKVMLN
jgi:Ca2+-binding EF-hand superfamily protein